MKTILIAVACRNASGMADMPRFTVEVSEDEYDLGVHFDKAETMAKEAGYEAPFVSFDDVERGAILKAAMELELVPRVVAVEITEGMVRSVRCDAGEIKVIYFDESDTDMRSDAVGEYPVGKGGALVKCWAHIQTADVDRGLAKARD